MKRAQRDQSGPQGPPGWTLRIRINISGVCMEPSVSEKSQDGWGNRAEHLHKSQHIVSPEVKFVFRQRRQQTAAPPEPLPEELTRF